MATPPPTAAVLVRRNADAAPMADALTARGVPVEVVGLAGLLAVPEVADVVAMLRLVADPTAGAAAMRVLTGPRWRLGGRDIAALWRRAVELDDHRATLPDVDAVDQIVAMPPRPTPTPPAWPTPSAIPGTAAAYSPAGYRRIVALGRELTALRAHLSHPLPELVAEVRRVLGVDAEVRAASRCRRAGRAPSTSTRSPTWSPTSPAGHGATVSGLLAYLDAAEQVENGLAPAEVSVAQDRVQILTVHAAKGLEWQVVAVPHLSGRVFPSTASTRTWLTDAGDLPPLLRGDRADRVRARCAGARHLGRQRPKAVVRQDLRSPDAVSISAASTRSAGCCTSRSPARRTRCCCRATIGAPPSPNLAARRSSSCELKDDHRAVGRRGRSLRGHRALGARTLPMVSRTRCATR